MMIKKNTCFYFSPQSTQRVHRVEFATKRIGPAIPIHEKSPPRRIRFLSSGYQPKERKKPKGQKPKGKKRRSRLSRLRRKARNSMSRRFVLCKQEVDLQQDSLGQIEPLTHCEVPDRKVERNLSAFQRLVGNPRVRKKFVKICRGVLSDLGVALVGPVPFRLLEIMWEYFGEEHFSAHGRACWCQLCRSVGPARFSFLQSIGDSLYSYFVSWKFAVNATFGLIAPAPLRMAKFVANKLWKWLKIVLSD
jgi:hypothetical protein